MGKKIPSWADENDDIIRGYRWVATLDDITCIGCGVRDGLRYDPAFEPIGHSVPWGGGPGERHRGCRCAMIPVLDAEYENYMRGATRPAVVHGCVRHVDAAVPYSQWIKSQSESFQNEVMGVDRARLFRDLHLDLVDLVDEVGDPLSYRDLLAHLAK